MAKLTENSFRDVNIAFANELSVIADKLDIDVWELIALANRHPGVNILQPGSVVGSHCIAVDPWFIFSSAPEQVRLIRTAHQVNDAKPGWVIEKVLAAIGEFVMQNTGKTAADVFLAIYGIAFKPDIDHLRESPAMKIAEYFTNSMEAQVIIIERNFEKLSISLSRAKLFETSEAVKKADIEVYLVRRKQFRPPEDNNRMKLDFSDLING